MATRADDLRERLIRAREREEEDERQESQERPGPSRPEERPEDPSQLLRQLLQEARGDDGGPERASSEPRTSPEPPSGESSRLRTLLGEARSQEEPTGERPDTARRGRRGRRAPEDREEDEGLLLVPRAFEAARGLARGGVGQLVEGIGQTIQAAPEMVGRAGEVLLPLERVRAQQEGAQRQEAAERGEVFQEPEPTDFQRQTRAAFRAAGEPVERVGRAMQEAIPESERAAAGREAGDLTNIDYLISGGSEAIGQIGAQMALALGTGGESALAQFMLFAGPTVALEAGGSFRETKDRLMEAGVGEQEAHEKAAGVALTTGVGAMALERVPAGRFVFNRIPGLGRIFSSEVAERLAGRGGSVVGNLITGAGTEAMQEMSQEAWAAAVDRFQGENPDAWENLPDRLKAAAVFGAIGGTGGAAFDMAARRGQVDPASQEEQEAIGDLLRGWRTKDEALTADAAARLEEMGVFVEPEEAAEAPREGEAAETPAEAPTEAEEEPGGLRDRLRRAAGGLRRRAAEVVDPSMREELEEAYRDPMTGLPNQAAFERARERLDEDENVELVEIDLTNFKAINDNLGREAGDERLQEAARVARQAAIDAGIPARDVFRAGGDEFAIAVPRGQGDQVGQAIVDQLPDVEIPGTDFTSRARYGVGQTFNEADQAAQEAKAEEAGARFRDVKAAPEEDISPEIPAPPTDLGRFEVRPLEEGGFEVVNTDTGRRFGTTTRRGRAEELADELSQGEFEGVQRREGETQPAEEAGRPRIPAEGEPSVEERVQVEEFTDAEGETRFRVVDDATGRVLRRRDTRKAADQARGQIVDIGALPGEPSAETQARLQVEREQFPGRPVEAAPEGEAAPVAQSRQEAEELAGTLQPGDRIVNTEDPADSWTVSSVLRDGDVAVETEDGDVQVLPGADLLTPTPFERPDGSRGTSTYRVERAPAAAGDPRARARELMQAEDRSRDEQVQTLRDEFPAEFEGMTDRQVLRDYLLAERKAMADEAAREELGAEQVAQIEARARELLEGGTQPEAVAQRIRGEFPDTQDVTVRRLRSSFIDPIREELQARREGRQPPAPPSGPAETGPRIIERGPDAGPIEAEAFHGTNQPVTTFDDARRGMATRASSAGLGHFFSSDPEVASAYADAAASRLRRDRPGYEREIQRLQDLVESTERKARRTGDWEPHERAMQELEDFDLGTMREPDSGQNIVPVQLRLANPMEVEAAGGTISFVSQLGEPEVETFTDLVRLAHERGHDGLVVRNLRDAPEPATNIESDHFVVFDTDAIRSRFEEPAGVPRETTEGRERVETDAGAVEVEPRVVAGRTFPGEDVYDPVSGDFLGKVVPVDEGFSVMGAGVSGRGIFPTRLEALEALVDVTAEGPLPSPDTTEGRMVLPSGLIIDNEGGLGATGFNRNVNYRGFTIMLHPSEYERLALELVSELEGRPDRFDQAQEDGQGIASPFFEVVLPEDSESGGWELAGHEGRHRMRWILDRFGDSPIPVHIIPRQDARARDISDDDFRDLLNIGVRQEPNRQLRMEDQDLEWVKLGREIRVFHEGEEKTFVPGEELEGRTEEDVQEEIQERREEGTLPSDVYNIDPAEIDVEPERFQFKRDVGKKGVGKELEEVGRWDPNLGGIIQVWRDPNDGRLKVVNGHHRLDLALRLGVEEVLVREVDAANAREARLIGALTNIAEGRGTPVDAAKLFRDEGITTEQLEELGISLRGEVAKLGTALSHLQQTIFRDVATGRLPARRAAVIGGADLTENQQLALYDMIRDLEERGKRPTNNEVGELIRFVKGAGETETTQDTLFGEETVRQSNAMEKAKLSSWVKTRLSRDRRLFGYLTRAGRAQRIEAEGAGRIDVDRSEDIATTSAQAEELYERLSTRAGPINAALTRAAGRLARQEESEDAIKKELYDEITEALEGFSGRPEGGRAADEGGSPPDEQTGLEGVREGPVEYGPASEVEARAIEEFGLTQDPADAGYVLPDGSWLDFSAGGGFGRVEDHRSIGRAYEEDTELQEGVEARAGTNVHFLEDFMARGNARFGMTRNGDVRVEFSRPLTRQQIDAILDARLWGTGRIYVDVTTPGDSFASRESAAFGDTAGRAEVKAELQRLSRLAETSPPGDTTNPAAIDRAQEPEAGILSARIYPSHSDRTLSEARVRDVAVALRDGDPDAIETASDAIVERHPGHANVVWVPIPDGRGANAKLAAAIARKTEGRSLELLGEGPARPSSYERRRQGLPGLSADQIEFQARELAEEPDVLDAEIRFVDNVVVTGSTFEAAAEALDRPDATLIAYAKEPNTRVQWEKEVRQRRQIDDTGRGSEGTSPSDVLNEMAFFEEGQVGAKMDKSLLRKLGANMYTRNPGWVVSKEALQNSIDALRLDPEGVVKIELGTTQEGNTFRIEDNGSGMTPEVAANQFMDPGGSEKPGGSSGGYGLAKVGLFSSARHISMSTVALLEDNTKAHTTVRGTLEDWFEGTMEYSTAPAADDAETGTVLELQIDPESDYRQRDARDFLKRFLTNDQTAPAIEVKIDGLILDPENLQQRYTYPDTPTKKVSVRGAMVHFYESEETTVTSSPGTIVLNNGLYQFFDTVYLGNRGVYPQSIIVDVRPQVPTTSDQYPFTTSRESLKGAAKDAIERSFRASGLDQQQNRYLRLVTLLMRPRRLAGSRYSIYPDSLTISPTTLEALDQADYLVPLMDRFAAVLDDVVQVGTERYGMGAPEFGGIGLSPNWLGLNVYRKAMKDMYQDIRDEAMRAGVSEDQLVTEVDVPERNLILFNPYGVWNELEASYPPGMTEEEKLDILAGQTWATIVHEAAHQVAGGHNEEFAGAQTRLGGMVGARGAEHIEAIREGWRTILQDDNFERHARILENEWSNDDSVLGEIGSHTSSESSRRLPGERDEAGDQPPGAPVPGEGGRAGRDQPGGRPDRVREGPGGRRGQRGPGPHLVRADDYGVVARETPTEDQLELVFGSVEAAQDAISDVADTSEELMEVSIPGVPSAEERIRDVTRGVEAGYAWVPATGQVVATPDGQLDREKVFQLFRAYRHPSAEYWHVMVLVPTEGGHEVVHHRMSSSGAFDTALIHHGDIIEAAAIARRLGGQVFMGHNHPSGNPTPSPEDAAVTRKATEIVADAGAEFYGHMVIDGGEATFQDGTKRQGGGMTTEAIRSPLPDDAIDWTVGPMERIGRPRDVFGYLKALPFDENRLDVLLLSSQHTVVALETRPMSDLASIDEWLPGLQRDAGAPTAILGAANRAAQERVIQRIEAAGSVLSVLDVMDVEGRRGAPQDASVMGKGRPTAVPIFERGPEYGRDPEVQREEPAEEAPGARRAQEPAQVPPEGEAGLEGELRRAQRTIDQATRRVERVAQRFQQPEPEPEAPRSPQEIREERGEPLPPELRGLGEEGFLDLSIFTGGRRHPQDPPLLTSQYEEVERRWQAAKGAERGSVLRKMKESLANARRAFTRHFPRLDAEESDTMGMTVDALRLEEAAPHWAEAVAYDELTTIVEGLDSNQLDVLTRNLVLPDIQKDIENGLYDGKDLPFGYEDAAAVQTDLDAAQEVMAQDPTIQSAFDRRQEFNRRLTGELVAADLLPAEVLEDDRYYHRQVLEHLNAMDYQTVGTRGGRDLRMKKKGFQRSRVGGSDFNTAYQEAEFEWVAQAYASLARVQTLERVNDLQNIKPSLKARAREHNRTRFEEKTRGPDLFGEPDPAQDPLLPFRQRIAFSNQSLAELAGDGELEAGPYNHVARELRDQWIRHQEESPGEDFRFNHEDWFNFLRQLVVQGEAGAREAATIFKAIRERNQTIENTLGDEFVTWEDLVPEGYTVWQPEKGSHFFMGLTVEERVLENAIEENRALQEEEVREMLVVGGPKDQWVIPVELAETMDDFQPTKRDDDPMETLWVQAQQSWKQWVLLNPFRFAKYNLNNMSGDLDISLAYDPKIAMKYGMQAAKDLASHRRGNADEALTEEILEATRLGVLQSGLRVAEIPDISDTGAFRLLVGKETRIDQKVIEEYWENIRGFTDWRENILRLAALRYFRDRIQAGETDIYAASSPAEVDAIADPEEKAAKLARELIGDYGNISRSGQWLRRRMIPFYSWLEINASRWIRMVRNTKHEGQTRGRGRRTTAAIGKKIAWNATKLGIKANMLFLAVNLWNKLFWPDEDEEVNRGRRQLHIILGRREDGTVISLRFEGALSDFLEWINLQNYPHDIAELVEDPSYARDMAYEAVKAPIEKIINSLEPFTKTIMELSLGRRTWPTIFEEGDSFRRRTSPIRDPLSHALGVFSMDRLADQVRKLPGGRPPRPRRQTGAFDRLVTSVLLYQTDPGEAAYWAVRGETFDWMRDQGVEAPSMQPTERSNSIYYWRRAVQWGDEDAAEAWRERYFELGGTEDGLEQSIDRVAPLSTIPKDQRDEFLETLDDRERQMLEKAQEWYEATLGSAIPSGGPRRPGRRRRQRRAPSRRRR